MTSNCEMTTYSLVTLFETGRERAQEFTAAAWPVYESHKRNNSYEFHCAPCHHTYTC
jgi:hypothetical protein